MLANEVISKIKENDDQELTCDFFHNVLVRNLCTQCSAS